MSANSRISLHIVDQSNCCIRLTVWSELAKRYDDDLVIAAKNNVVLATKVKTDIYDDEHCIATTDYSDLFVELVGLDEILTMKNWFSKDKVKGKISTSICTYSKKQVERSTQFVVFHAQSNIDKNGSQDVIDQIFEELVGKTFTF